MIRYNKLLNLRALLSGFGALLLLASCSSYQYSGYDDDGIYASSREGKAYTADDYEESYENALYYKQLFGEKAQQFENVPEEGAVFTDIEGYSSGYGEAVAVEEGINYQTGRPAWGTDPDRISINIYQDPFYSPYMYGGYAGFYDPFYGPFYPGFRYGYGYPYAYNSWRFGWNWGYGYGYPYYGNPYHPFYGGGHYYGNFNRNNVAYSNSRRDTYYAVNRSYRTDDAQATSRIERYSNSRNIRATRTGDDDRTYRTRSTRVRSSDERGTGTYTRSADTRTVREARRSSSSNSPAYRSSRSTTRSSGTYNSASSSTRSSATRSSSSGSTSRSSRGRGN